jgi:hypothetical protein
MWQNPCHQRVYGAWAAPGSHIICTASWRPWEEAPFSKHTLRLRGWAHPSHPQNIICCCGLITVTSFEYIISFQSPSVPLKQYPFARADMVTSKVRLRTSLLSRSSSGPYRGGYRAARLSSWTSRETHPLPPRVGSAGVLAPPLWTSMAGIH